VASLSTQFKRNLLNGIRWDAQDNGLTLAQALKSAARARLSENSTGQHLLSSEGNGAKVVFALPQSDTKISPEAITSATGELYDRYNQAKADLISAGVSTAPSDDLILTEMLARLNPRKTMADDFSTMRMR